MDGTLGVIFIVWALMGLDPDAPFARYPADRSLAIAPGETFVDEVSRGYELRANLLADHRFGTLQPMIDVSVSENGGIYAGSGFHQEMDLVGPVYFAGSGVTGLWFRGGDADLGSMIEFRTTFELGFRITAASRLGIAWDHRSNLGLGDINPGMETVSLRYGMRF